LADVAAVGFRLRVQGGVAIDLGGGGLEDPRAQPPRQVQQVDGAMHRGPHPVVLVVNRGGRAGKIVDVVHLDLDGLRDVVADHLEIRMRQQVADAVARPGEEAVQADHCLALGKQPLAEVGAEETGAAGDQDAIARTLHAMAPLLPGWRGHDAPAGVAGA
jgi:hypothetical protein